MNDSSSFSGGAARLAEFCLFGSARTGSTQLVAALGKSPDIVCHDEIFHNKRFNLPREYRRLLTLKSIDDRQAHPYRFLQELNRVDSGRHPERRLLGFKIFPAHANQLWKSLLREPGRAKVLIHRENRLAQYSSLRVAQQEGRWKSSSARPQAEAGAPRVAFDAAEFDQWRRRQDRFEAAFAEDGVADTVFRIEYRRINEGDTLRALLAHLGARAADDMQGHLEKQNGRDIVSRFGNPDDVRAVLDRIGHPEWAVE